MASPTPDIQGVPLHDEFPREAIAGDGRDFAAVDRIRYIALRNGVIAADARLRMAEGVAQLALVTTAPACRRRGCGPRYSDTVRSSEQAPSHRLTSIW